MNQKNYQRELEQIIQKQSEQEVKSVFLHSCCAPCSSYCLELLSQYFNVTVFYYNPNIYPPEEYAMRVKEQERFVKEFPAKHPITFVAGDYIPDKF